MVIKGGFIAWSQMGDPNASIPTPQPVFMRPMFGAFRIGGWADLRRVCQPGFAGKQASLPSYGLHQAHRSRARLPQARQKDMKWNDATPHITVDPGNLRSHCRRRVAGLRAGDKLPLAQRYFLF